MPLSIAYQKDDGIWMSKTFHRSFNNGDGLVSQSTNKPRGLNFSYNINGKVFYSTEELFNGKTPLDQAKNKKLLIDFSNKKPKDDKTHDQFPTEVQEKINENLKKYKEQQQNLSPEEKKEQERKKAIRDYFQKKLDKSKEENKPKEEKTSKTGFFNQQQESKQQPQGIPLEPINNFNWGNLFAVLIADDSITSQTIYDNFRSAVQQAQQTYIHRDTNESSNHRSKNAADYENQINTKLVADYKTRFGESEYPNILAKTLPNSVEKESLIKEIRTYLYEALSTTKKIGLFSKSSGNNKKSFRFLLFCSVFHQLYTLADTKNDNKLSYKQLRESGNTEAIFQTFNNYINEAARQATRQFNK